VWLVVLFLVRVLRECFYAARDRGVILWVVQRDVAMLILVTGGW
jgi:hypothetical protein